MSSIESAIEKLEEASSRLRDLGAEEARDIKDAVANAEREAKAKIKAEFADRRKALKSEMNEARQAVREAQSRISKALEAPAKSGNHRAPAGLREQQILETVKASPGLRQADIARKMDVHAATISPVMRRMVENGELKRDGEKAYTAA